MRVPARWSLYAFAVVVLLSASGLIGTASSSAQEASGLTVTRWNLTTPVPVDIVPLPDGHILVASQTDGRIVLVTASGKELGTVTTMPSQPPTGEYGLLGMTLHPDFENEPFVYVFYTQRAGLTIIPTTQVIARFTYDMATAQTGALQTLVTLTAGPACCHNGGRLAFGPDGMLYATLGEHMVQPLSQAPYAPPGSVLRYTPTGEVPADNPFPGSPVAVSGLRNPFGLAFDAEWGMVVTDNGPSGTDGPGGFDEVNLFHIGDNGGWPVARGKANHVFPFTAPLWDSGNAHVAPTGVMVPRGSAVSAWDGLAVFCNYNAGTAKGIDPSQPNPVPVDVFSGCRYSVAQHPDGRILFGDNGKIWAVS